MKLSKNFYLYEFEKSQIADRNGINNYAPGNVIKNLIVLCERVLQPLRNELMKPITINSGYRSIEVNRKLGSNDNSQHVKGEAADIEVAGINNYDLFHYIRGSGFIYDQLILEFHKANHPNSGWVHVSRVKDIEKNREMSFNLP